MGPEPEFLSPVATGLGSPTCLMNLFLTPVSTIAAVTILVSAPAVEITFVVARMSIIAVAMT